jgi:hypothetical protein
VTKYGFGGGIELPKLDKSDTLRPKAEPSSINDAVRAGSNLGFVNREPQTRLKPGPRRTEPQGKVSIPGPSRVIDEFRAFCQSHNMTLWQGLELLLERQKGREL